MSATDVDIEFFHFLAREIDAAVSVLHDIEHAQLFCSRGHGHDAARDVVRKALVNIIRDDTARLRSDLRKCLPAPKGQGVA